MYPTIVVAFEEALLSWLRPLLVIVVVLALLRFQLRSCPWEITTCVGSGHAGATDCDDDDDDAWAMDYFDTYNVVVNYTFDKDEIPRTSSIDKRRDWVPRTQHERGGDDGSAETKENVTRDCRPIIQST